MSIPSIREVVMDLRRSGLAERRRPESTFSGTNPFDANPRPSAKDVEKFYAEARKQLRSSMGLQAADQGIDLSGHRGRMYGEITYPNVAMGGRFYELIMFLIAFPNSFDFFKGKNGVLVEVGFVSGNEERYFGRKGNRFVPAR